MKRKFDVKQHQCSYQVETRVLYSDTDQMGVVYYANYFVWFEQGRTELMRALGAPYKEIENSGVFLPVSQCSCKYKSPACYDDIIQISTTVTALTEVSITFSYHLWKKETGELLATGESKHPFLNSRNELIRFGKTIFDIIVQQEAEK